MSCPLASFPEELLARILSLSFPPPRPASDLFPLLPARSRIAPLLVCKKFFRIASPFLYHTLHLRSSYQATRALDSLTHNPTLADAVRRVVFDGIWHDCAGVLVLCIHVQDIDIRLDGGPCHHDLDAEAFCYALEQQRSITHLTIRKDPAVYLTHPRPVYVLQRLARVLHRWTDLETVHFAFRISSSLSTLPLARALSVAPRLRSVRAQLPAVWNDLLLVISTNPDLEKIMLYAEPMLGSIQGRLHASMGPTAIKGGYICDDIEHAVLGSGLYMMEAKMHARLSELIKSGTWVIRTRAHTTISTLSTPSAGGTPLGAIRAKEVAVDLISANYDSLGLPATQPFTATRHSYTRDI